MSVSLRTLSIRGKLTVLAMASTVAALVLTSSTLIGLQWSHGRAELTRELGAMAQMIAATSRAALQFEDAARAEEILATLLATDSRLVSGRIVLPGGVVLAEWQQEPAPARGKSASRPTIVTVRRDVVLDGEFVGGIELSGDESSARASWQDYVILVAVLLAVSVGVALLLALRLQRLVSAPILELACHAGRVSAERDYSIRVTPGSPDELGMLFARFNEMLSQIESRDHALSEARDQLEARVRERTAELRGEIAERERTEQALIEARDAAEAASRAKSAFVANMSHELRTPLNAILGYSELLHEEAAAAGQIEGLEDLEKIQRAGRHLLDLINGVLDLSKIEAGKMTTSVSTIDLRRLVDDVLATASSLAGQRRNHVRLEAPDALGTMQTDETRVRQVLLNLLSNAVKFTEDGEIRLVVSRRSTATGDVVRFEIHDTGIGMSPEQVGRLFADFSQADESTTRKYGGTGLGLAISRRLCRLLGGDIAVTSRAGAGSTFIVTLPAESRPAADGGPDPEVDRGGRADVAEPPGGRAAA